MCNKPFKDVCLQDKMWSKCKKNVNHRCDSQMWKKCDSHFFQMAHLTTLTDFFNMLGHICKLQAHKSRDVSKTYLKQSILWANVTVKKVTYVTMSSNVPFEKNVNHIFFTSVNHICDLHFFTFASHFILQTHIFEWFIAHLRYYWPKDYMCY